MASDEYNIVDINPKSSSGSCSGDTNFSDTSTPNVDEGNNSTCNTHGSIGISDKLDQLDDIIVDNALHNTTKPDDDIGSPSTGRCDPVRSSLESSDLNVWVRSGKQGTMHCCEKKKTDKKFKNFRFRKLCSIVGIFHKSG